MPYQTANQNVPLPPRLALTLDLLLQAESEKRIALKLGLSNHTVHDYVKSLHKHFGVNWHGIFAICVQGSHVTRADLPNR